MRCSILCPDTVRLATDAWWEADEWHPIAPLPQTKVQRCRRRPRTLEGFTEGTLRGRTSAGKERGQINCPKVHTPFQHCSLDWDNCRRPVQPITIESQWPVRSHLMAGQGVTETVHPNWPAPPVSSFIPCFRCFGLHRPWLRLALVSWRKFRYAV